MEKLQAMTHREKQLEKMDAVYIKSLLPTCRKGISTTKADYVDHTGTAVYNPPIRQVQMDPSLITGHFADNLKVCGVENRTKTWPQAMDWREDYAQFVKRNKWCNEEIYKLFFVSPPINYELLKSYIKDLRKSVYMYDYSRNVYITRARRVPVTDRFFPFYSKNIDYLTTYGCSYNRLQETEPFLSACYSLHRVKNMTLDTFAANMRKLFTKYNVSTYFDEICAPALLKAKNGIMPSGPIDRYQFRKY